ncbi:hypothetical protein [Brevundimonas sp.]|uniref:hypothetical protein n=1 Tax=Brevundimonas sp. TaxID=1871086 RepID=UPI003569787A
MRKSHSRASGRNDAWFAAACILGIAGLGLCSEAKAQDNPAIPDGVDLTKNGFYPGGYQRTSNLAVDVRCHDTDQHDFGDGYGARAAATLKASF